MVMTVSENEMTMRHDFLSNCRKLVLPADPTGLSKLHSMVDT